MERTSLTQRKARKKGMVTLVAGVGTAASFIFISPWLGVIGLGLTGYFGYRWLKYRGEWGMRF